MNITDIRIRRTYCENRLRALVSITIDHDLALHDIKIIQGADRLFVAMPSRRDENGEFRDICHPITLQARQQLEQAVLDNDTGRFLHRMSVIRKELNRTNRYYAQLCDFASTLLEDAEEQLSGHSKKRLNHFLRKVENLRGETRMLHEYATQISSEYQAQVDIDQNRVMKVLTIVTAIFLPLTLIAGWYGMNFPNILLLGWRYGYAAVAIVSALVVVLLIWYFKRKKWF